MGGGESRCVLSRGLISGGLGDSLYDSTPLLRTIRSALTPELVAAIGTEYREKGRLLFVATTNLDVPVGVRWFGERAPWTPWISHDVPCSVLAC